MQIDENINKYEKYNNKYFITINECEIRINKLIIFIYLFSLPLVIGILLLVIGYVDGPKLNLDNIAKYLIVGRILCLISILGIFIALLKIAAYKFKILCNVQFYKYISCGLDEYKAYVEISSWVNKRLFINIITLSLFPIIYVYYLNLIIKMEIEYEIENK